MTLRNLARDLDEWNIRASSRQVLATVRGLAADDDIGSTGGGEYHLRMIAAALLWRLELGAETGAGESVSYDDRIDDKTRRRVLRRFARPGRLHWQTRMVLWNVVELVAYLFWIRSGGDHERVVSKRAERSARRAILKEVREYAEDFGRGPS